ncbi:MAG TPA: Na+/H+ antiporter, partial [Planctomycetota bacterium]|nr:Na+/H+ antiporter [Planctomycetota bacterium]
MPTPPLGLVAAFASALLAEGAGLVTAPHVETFVELMIVAALVALVAKRLRTPYTVALTLVGVAVGFLHVLPPVTFSKETVLLVFLPPLLFEGTLAMDLATLRGRWREVTLLALPGTLVSVAAIAWPVHAIFGLDLRYCLLLGAILAPTDPVSVIALFKEAGVPRRLSVIVEGESCFNDGVGVGLYALLLGALEGRAPTLGEGARFFAVEVAGGAVVGGVLGYLVYRILRHIDDHLVEVMISLVLAYGVYVVAERFAFSGVVSVVTAGLVMGNYGQNYAMSATTRLALSHFWEVMAFLANSLVFLTMGIAIESTHLVGAAARIGVAYGLLTASRLALVQLACLLAGVGGRGVPSEWRHVIGWSGLRGALCVALAIGLPDPLGPAGAAGIPSRAETLTLVSGVVLLSMLVQGLTMRPLLRRLGVGRRSDVEEAYDLEVARELALAAAAGELETLRREGRLPTLVAQEIGGSLSRRRDASTGRIGALLDAHPQLIEARRRHAAHGLALAARAALDEAYRRGEIAADAHDRVAGEVEGWIAPEPEP